MAITVPAALESLDRIAEYVKQSAEAAKLDGKRAYALRLAVDELVTNIITHGYEEVGGQGDLRVQAEVDEDAVTIIVEDTASEFDPTGFGEPEDMRQPLEDRQIGGLGIFLVRRNVDEWRYERDGGLNRNTLVVRGRRQQR